MNATIPCNAILQDGTIGDTLEPVTQLQSPFIGGLQMSDANGPLGTDCHFFSLFLVCFLYEIIGEVINSWSSDGLT